MKKGLLILAVIPLLFSSCSIAHILTELAEVDYVPYSDIAQVRDDVQRSFSTTVISPRTKVVTTTTYRLEDDIAFHLDLQAVGAAFAQSNSVQEFEAILNNNSYMLTNLDLNRDGYVDYLRVMETVQGRNHIFVIQAVLGWNVYQDVATVVAEVMSAYSCYVQVIGAPFIYGPKYIIRPVYAGVPPIFAHLFRPAYKPWSSPWYWDHFPSHYRRPAPIPYSHYHAYVNTFMSNHRYCRQFEYANDYHYRDYERYAAPLMRSDYAQQHPERSFTYRTADIPTGNTSASSSTTTRPTNARDLIIRRDAEATTTTSSTRSAASASRASTSSASSSSSSASRSASSSASRSASSTSSTSSTSSSSSASRASTSSASSSSSSASRSASSSASRSASSSASRSASSTSSSSSASRVTVQSSVRNASGSSDTRIRTQSSNGESTSVRRGSTSSSSSSSSATRSAATTSSSSRSTSGTTRSASSGSRR